MGKLSDVLNALSTIHDSTLKQGFPLPKPSASFTSVTAKSPPISASQLRYDVYDLPKALRSKELPRRNSRDDNSMSPPAGQYAAILSAADFAALTAESSYGEVRLRLSPEFKGVLMILQTNVSPVLTDKLADPFNTEAFGASHQYT